jgi:hypothetical protein
VDDWSRAVFEELLASPISANRSWTRWEPGYLLLTIEEFNGRKVEALFVDRTREEITVEFGYSETHLPEPLGTREGGTTDAANQAVGLVEQWLSGEIWTAVYTDGAKKWNEAQQWRRNNSDHVPLLGRPVRAFRCSLASSRESVGEALTR